VPVTSRHAVRPSRPTPDRVRQGRAVRFIHRENQHARSNGAVDLERAKRLRYAAAARAKAVEDKTLALQRLELKGESLPRSNFAEWSQKPVDTNLRLQELNARLHRPQSERDLTGVRAPASGDLEQFSGLSPGSYVQASQTVCWISREGELVADIYVSPKDIGFVRQGQTARLQVDAFNSNQWGARRDSAGHTGFRPAR
jgi:membrane fusion protein, peptide pheromone/bacteriocin exporter